MGCLRTCLAAASAVAAALAASGCVAFDEPLEACPTPLAGQPAAPVRRGVVLAASLPDGAVAVTVDCTGTPCRFSEVPLHAPDGTGLPSGTPLVLSGDARHVVGLEPGSGRLLHWDLSLPTPGSSVDETPLDVRLVEIVAPMRTGATILLRDEGGVLWAHHVDSRVLTPLADADQAVRAVGERFVVLERVVDGTHRDVSVVDVLDALARPVPLLLGVPTPTAVAFAPQDAALALTIPTDTDETVVFGADEDGAFVLDDRLAGSLPHTRGTVPLAGLSAFAPDGGAFVVRTPAGGLGLRDRTTRTTCALWPAGQADVEVAGFSAAGRLFLEQEAGDGRGLVVLAPGSGSAAPLAPGHDLRLFAAPAGDDTAPWAVGVRDGTFFGAGVGGPPRYLPRRRVSFVASAGHLFAVAARAKDAPTAAPGDRELAVHHLLPPGADPEGWSDPLPIQVERPAGERAPFAVTLSAADHVCIAGRFPEPWARRCGDAGADTFLVGASPPSTEAGGG